MRKPACLRQVINAVLLLVGLALVAIAAAYALAARQCLELKPTGDKLYDRFAAAVRARQGLKLYGGLGGSDTLLPASSVLSWEAQFKDEPRYWQLRYWLGLAEYASQQTAALAKSGPSSPQAGTPAPQQPAAAGNVLPPSGAPEPAAPQRKPVDEPDVLPQKLLEPLQQAVASGNADENVYLLLYEGELAAMDPAATVAQRQPMLALLDKAVDFGSGLSWGYYLRAIHRLDILKGESVDWHAVRADLDQGNAAQLNVRPLAFPQSYVEQQLAGNGRAAGSQVLAGAVLECGEQAEGQIPLSRTLARATRICIAHCIEANDQELAGAMALCLCRMASAEDALPQEKVEIASSLRVIADYLGTRIDTPATWQQREDVFEVTRWLNDSSGMGRVALDDVEQARLKSLALYYWLSDAVDKRQDGDTQAQADRPSIVPCYVLYKTVYDLRCAERELIFERFNSLLDSLRRFDFKTLRLPYDLSPINQPGRLPRRTPPATVPAQP